MRSRGLALSLVLVASCTRPTARPAQNPPPVAVAPRDAGAAVDAPLDAAPAADVRAAPVVAPGPWASAWTDPGAIARLVDDCNYHPPTTDDPEELDPLDCDADIEHQSCNYDPCHENVDAPCRRVCGRTCHGCDARCRTSCGRCRAACHDDACVRACATSCGQCLQSCIAAKDSCITAGCTARYQACFQRSIDHFRNGPCLALCTRCTERCPSEGPAGQCLSRCLARGHACTGEEANHCAWDGPNFGRPEPELEAEHADGGPDAGP